MTPRILFVVNADWYFLSHRLPLAQALRRSGAVVIVATSEEGGLAQRIRDEGFEFHPLPLDRRSASPWVEVRTLRALARLYRTLKPDVIHQLTIKPVIYGSLAAWWVGARHVVNTIPGLGYMFSGRGVAATIRRWFATALYRVAFMATPGWVVFQNQDDKALLVGKGVVAEAKSVVIPGSGVDIERFRPSPAPAGVPTAMLASRLLWSKGVGVFADAAKLVRARKIACRFVLVGRPDTGSPDHVSADVLGRWTSDGLLEWWGEQDDMPSVLARASVVVLPSYYREGVPRVLIEAAACARPLVAADVPGSRDIVRHGTTGLLVPPRDAEALAVAIGQIVERVDMALAMGQAGRRLVEDRFAEAKIIDQTMAVYERVVGRAWYLDDARRSAGSVVPES